MMRCLHDFPTIDLSKVIEWVNNDYITNNVLLSLSLIQLEIRGSSSSTMGILWQPVLISAINHAKKRTSCQEYLILNFGARLRNENKFHFFLMKLTTIQLFFHGRIFIFFALITLNQLYYSPRFLSNFVPWLWFLSGQIIRNLCLFNWRPLLWFQRKTAFLSNRFLYKLRESKRAQ